MNNYRIHTTIGLKKATKERLETKKAPGQCYDGFLCQLMDLWEETHNTCEKNNSKMPRNKRYTYCSSLRNA